MSASLFATPPPTVALAIGGRSVTGVALAGRGGGALISAHASEPVPPGLVTPSLGGHNVSDPPALGAVVGRVLSRLGGRPRRVALVLPDTVAKVSLVRLDKVPPRAEDLDQLIRWHVRKAAPFHVEDAQVAFSPGIALEGGGREFVVALARREAVREYEAACEAAGAHPGLVDLATFSLVNAVLAAEGSLAGDWLLVHVTPDYGTIAILRGEDVILFRNRAEGSDETLPDLVHQTAMYYEDRLGGRAGFARVILAADGPGTAGAGPEEIRRQIDGRLGVRTETFDPQRVARFADRIVADASLVTSVAPLVGVLARAART